MQHRVGRVGSCNKEGPSYNVGHHFSVVGFCSLGILVRVGTLYTFHGFIVDKVATQCIMMIHRHLARGE